ncbi:hypothetical protein GCM10011575_44490 [Microlunatus endophyticus]|uniref:Type II secretion system protein GspF domain-containing protein n=1 Tax=Microlunatus endophyticus TaxID=1716077 RepID=A0A917W9I3_9ACTN|nr:type II secretion system F family protein [Microlunatus endophyticus]GGL81297.1 hypothetical protein GCM10011575_44490 [Microlunatus endophyticus]
MIISQLYGVLAVVLAGLAVGGAVSEPAAGLRRLRPSGDHDHPGREDPGGPTGGARSRPVAELIAALAAPRRGSPPTGQRAALAGAVAVVLPLGLQAVAGVGAQAWFAAPVAAAAGYLVSGRLQTPAYHRRRQRLVDGLPAALELLSAAIAAGLPLRSAVGEVLAVLDGPLAEDLQQVITSIDLGRDEATAWRSLRDHPALGPISVDLARSLESGTMIAATLQRHAAIARRNRRGDREARARTVGVKSVPPLMLCFVPAFLLISIVPIAASGIVQALQ